MKIKIIQLYFKEKYYCYNMLYAPKSYDYVYKYLDFDKLDKDWAIVFNNKKTEEWFSKTYINTDYLKDVYNNSPDGYGYLKNNWGKGIFKILVHYPDKQELKTIVNKIINVRLARSDI